MKVRNNSSNSTQTTTSGYRLICPRCKTELLEQESDFRNENGTKTNETVYTCDCGFKLTTIEEFTSIIKLKEIY